MMEHQTFDREGARKAFEVLRPRLDEQEESRTMNIDIYTAAIFAAAVGNMVRQPEVRAQFAQLPPNHFNITHVDELELAAQAVLYVVVMQDSASGGGRGKLAPDLVERATEVKQRMYRVVEYHLGDDDNVALELAKIRSGQSYLDLAADLIRLARQYEQHEPVLSSDRSHYRASDRDEADQLAYRIHSQLGQGVDTSAKHWAEYAQRAWSYLLTCYEEVRAAGRWLYRHDDGEEKFPSLFSMTRNRSRSSKNTDTPAPQEPAEPAAQAQAQA